ncbi:hypothetical protein QR680_016262 [Steinernema hermaphroditum]|uniref:Knottin scorpion toxin-like domain-containing protein n=1 Tax=Steinernema hermaphroditum TaxID=289476 RepID=A0AA39HAL4_9BILA|nr:hypothetical protein QR680_016262 [Steinernema hermaphroditum]
MSPKTLFFALFCLFAFAVSVGECHPGGDSALHSSQDWEQLCCANSLPCRHYCKLKGCLKERCFHDGYRGCTNACRCLDCTVEN